MSLRLIADSRPEAVFDPPRGRPGDWSEAIEIEALSREGIAATARALRVTADVIAAVLVEQTLLIRDLDEARAPTAALIAALEADAARTRPDVGPGKLLHGYVSELRRGTDDRADASSGAVLVIPLRLHEGASSLSAHEIELARAAQALRWEIAAASDGLLMREWGLRAAIRAVS